MIANGIGFSFDDVMWTLAVTTLHNYIKYCIVYVCVCVYVYIVKYLTVAKVHLLICLVRVERSVSFHSVPFRFDSIHSISIFFSIPDGLPNSAADHALYPTNPAAIWHSVRRSCPRRHRMPTHRRQSDPDADCRSNRSHAA